MKRQAWTGAIGLAALLLLGIPHGASAAIEVDVNGSPVAFPDQQPAMVQDRVLVPLRGVLEALGAKVQWNAADQSVTALRGGTTVQLAVGTRDASINLKPVTLDVPAQLIGGRVMVPLRFISESLGASVGWSDAQQLVSIRLLPPQAAVSQTPAHIPPPINTTRLAPLPVSRDVAVTDFNVTGTGPFHPGDSINVELRGTPGGKAFFTIGATGVLQPMQEKVPGDYVGTYRVPRGARGENVSVEGRLEKGGISSPLVVSPQPITIAAMPPGITDIQPAANAILSNLRPTIYAVFQGGSGAVDPAAVHLNVNGQDVTTRSTVTPDFITYTPPAPLPAGKVLVKVTAGDTNGLSATRSWVFSIKPRTGIKSLVESATGTLGAGDTLTVTLTGEPGGQAYFSLPGIIDRVPMAETGFPGQYTGSYTVRRGDQFVSQPLVAHLAATGADFTEKSTAPLTIWTKDPQKPEITTPAPNRRVGGSLQVTGAADPFAKVQLKVTYQQSVLGIFGANGTVVSETVMADRAGHFHTARIPLSGVFGTSGVHYTITATETNPAGQQSEATVVKVFS